MKNNFTIYYSGNSLLKEDSMPYLIVPRLQKIFPHIEFLHHDPSENLPAPSHVNNKYDIIILDTVINTDRVISIRDEKQLATQSVYSPHDFDLALNLKLLLKLGVIKTFLIIGVPPEGDKNVILTDIEKIINAL